MAVDIQAAGRLAAEAAGKQVPLQVSGIQAAQLTADIQVAEAADKPAAVAVGMQAVEVVDKSVADTSVAGMQAVVLAADRLAAEVADNLAADS